MKKTIITSTGIGSNDFREIFIGFIGEKPENPKLLYDTTAIDGESMLLKI